MKKALSLLLVLAMVLSMVPAVFAEEATVNTTFETIEAAIGAEVTYTFVPTENYRLCLEMTGDAAVTINGETVMDPVIEFPLPDNNEGAFDYVGGVTGEYVLEVWADTEYTIVVSGATNAATEVYVADTVYPGEVAEYPAWVEWMMGMPGRQMATVTVPANDTYYFTFAQNDADATPVIYNGEELVAYELDEISGFPVFTITNATDVEATYNLTMTLEYPLGHQNNPVVLEASKSAAASATAPVPAMVPWVCDGMYFYAVNTADDGYVIIESTDATALFGVDGETVESGYITAAYAYGVINIAVSKSDYAAGNVPFTVTYVADEIAAEMDAAAAVTEQIDALYEMNFETWENELVGSEDDIKAAQAAYEALSDSAKAYIDEETKAKLDDAVATLPEEPVFVPQEVTVSSLTLDLNAELILMFKVLMTDELKADPNAYLRVSFAGSVREIPVSKFIAENTPDSKGRYYVKQGIASPYMDLDMTLEIIDGNGVAANFIYKSENVGNTISFCALDYIEANISNTSLQPLFQGLLTYGGYAQTYFKSVGNQQATSNPVYDKLVEYGLTVGDLNEFNISNVADASVSGDAIGLTYKDVMVALDSAVYMTVRFDSDKSYALSDYTFEVTYYDASLKKNVTKTLEGYSTTSSSGKLRYCVDVENIAAALWDNYYTVTVTNNVTGGTYTASACVMNYVKSNVSGTNAKLVNLLKAMYFYNQKASTYFSI